MTSSDYKKDEREHYDSRYLTGVDNISYDSVIPLSDKVNEAARKYFESKTFEIINSKGGGEILDFGCGTGIKTHKYSSDKWKITGIDISGNSIRMAKKLSEMKKVNAQFFEMDCENLKFNDNRFDIVYDYGVFASLSIDQAIKEICRVLKKDGNLLSMETLGNNPIFSIKRKINVLFGKRTKWVANHVLKLEDWQRIRKFFASSEVRYFSLLTPYLVPLLKIIPNGKHDTIIGFFDRIDSVLLQNHLLQKLAFKVVVVMKDPVKLL